MRCIFPWIAGLLLVTWLGMACGWADAADGEFSEVKQIENRLNAARAELAALPPDADPEARDDLKRLIAAGEYHNYSTELLVEMRDELSRAKEENASWDPADVFHQLRNIHENVVIDALKNVAYDHAGLVESDGIDVIDMAAAIALRIQQCAVQGKVCGEIMHLVAGGS